MLARYLLLIGALLLNGCSTLSKEQCQTMSWYNLGYQDGEQGRSPAKWQDYRASCGEYGVSVDQQEWQRGYDKGLSLYCLPELAYNKGRSGHVYRGICPHDSAFLQEYQRGYQEYRMLRMVEALRGELERTEQYIDELEYRIDSETDRNLREDYIRKRYRALRRYDALRDDYYRLRYPDDYRSSRYGFGHSSSSSFPWPF